MTKKDAFPKFYINSFRSTIELVVRKGETTAYNKENTSGRRSTEKLQRNWKVGYDVDQKYSPGNCKWALYET